MSSPKRNRARILTASGLKKLREQMRSHEVDENAGFKYTLERLGELTGLDPETVKNVLDCKGSDKRTIARCFESFGLTLAESDHIPAAQATITADPNFVGRDEAIADLNTLVSRNARVIVIQARGGVGKTTLARKYLQQEFGSFLEFPIAKETKDIASIEGLLEEKLRQLGEEPGREFLVSLDRLKRKLQVERIGILIDNLEPALDSAGKFIEAHRRYVELLRVLSDPIVQSVTLITSRERLREADVTVQHYPLRSLSVQAWAQFFQSRSINTETSALATLHDAYGGNAKAMDIISGTVLEDFSGDVEAYWQANQDDLFIERDLEDLVTKQFDRLHQLDPDAYNLLCRMGCYRFQDITRVSIEGLLHLLWDVSEGQRRRIVKTLQDRSLVDFQNGKFWLHPVLRAEAIGRLKKSDDWEITNRKIAGFFRKSVETVEEIGDALGALEAYYHYAEISDFESAANVILEERINRWQIERLDTSLYRLGLFKELPTTITEIANSINSGYSLSGIYMVIGDSYALSGNTNKAIDFFERSASVAAAFNLNLFKALAFQNIGLYKLDVGELEESEKYFNQNIKYTENTDLHRYAVNAYCCLAFLKSHQKTNDSTQKANEFLQKALVEIPKTNLTIWGKLNSSFFLAGAYKNLGDLERAFELYANAISFAEKSHFILVEANALSGIAELYRSQRSFDIAISKHLESIDLLRKIGAKPDLAEALFQFALTYQKMDEVEEGKASFQEAIQLFNEMEAPKQVERVRLSMQN